MQLVHEELEVGRPYAVIGLVYMKNGCCEDKPVVITQARTPGGAISCQCACGGWCTNGHRTATAAVLEYNHMSKGHCNWDMTKMSGRLQELARIVESVAREA